jgi:uncharacterized repeat protein (TIGR01451 family)
MPAAQATLDFRVTVNTGVKIRDVISNQGTDHLWHNQCAHRRRPGDARQTADRDCWWVAAPSLALPPRAAAVVGGGALQPGGLLRYTIRLANTGSYSVTGATFADTIPANTTFVAADHRHAAHRHLHVHQR